MILFQNRGTKSFPYRLFKMRLSKSYKVWKLDLVPVPN